MNSLRQELTSVKSQLTLCQQHILDLQTSQQNAIARTPLAATTSSQPSSQLDSDFCDTSGDDDDDANDEIVDEMEVMSFPNAKPKPLEINVRGDNGSVRSGKYIPFGGCFKDLYVLADELEAGIKEKGFPDNRLITKPLLQFRYNDDHEGYQLVYTRGVEGTRIAEMLPDKTWRVFDEAVTANQRILLPAARRLTDTAQLLRGETNRAVDDENWTTNTALRVSY